MQFISCGINSRMNVGSNFSIAEKVKLMICQEGKTFSAKICDLSREGMQMTCRKDMLCDISGKPYPAQKIINTKKKHETVLNKLVRCVIKRHKEKSG